MDKLLVHRTHTKCVLGIYTSVLPILKEYVCLFQSSTCLVHKLHDEQEKLFRNFLALFVKPESFANLTAAELKKT